MLQVFAAHGKAHHGCECSISLCLFVVSIGKNQPLRPEKPKWKSDVPLTDGQIRSKRDEFWDTAPVFEVICDRTLLLVASTIVRY